MEALNIFTVNDLEQCSDVLLEDAKSGRLALITNQGRPAFLAVPFNERLLGYGVNRALALYFFETGMLTLSQAARVAGISLEECIELLGEMGIATVDYPAEELEKDLENALL